MVKGSVEDWRFKSEWLPLSDLNQNKDRRTIYDSDLLDENRKRFETEQKSK